MAREKYPRDERGRKPWEVEGIPRGTWQHRQKNGGRSYAEYAAARRASPAPNEGALGSRMKREWEKRRRAGSVGSDSRGAGAGLGDGEYTQELERCLAVYDRRKAAGEELSYEAIREEAGTSATPVRRALDIRRTEERLAEEKQWSLSASQQEKLEAAVRAHRKALEREFDRRVHDAAHEMVDKTLLARLEEREKRVRHFDAAWRGIFNRAEYQLLLKCLHPDSNCDPEQYNEAFRLVRQREDVLLKKEVRRPVGAEAMPKTFADMMARRR